MGFNSGFKGLNISYDICLVCFLQCLIAIIRKYNSWSFGSLDQYRICTYQFRSRPVRAWFKLRYCYCKWNVAKMGEGRD